MTNIDMIKTLEEKIDIIKLIECDIINVEFKKNTEIKPNDKAIKSFLKMGNSLGWDEDKNNFILKSDIKISRKLEDDSEQKLESEGDLDEKLQSEIEITSISLYEGESIKDLVELFSSSEEENKKLILNKLFSLSYPKIKKHIEYIFSSANMKMSIPNVLKVGD